MAPIMKELDLRKVDYCFINAGQHTKILDDISELFRLKNYDYSFESIGRDVATSIDMLIWMFKNTKKIFFPNQNVFNEGDLVLVHGDATPALFGLIIAKLKKLKVVHIE
ncbi:MAG: UDP-N-acetylglucosamine 2-epimerase, partial [Candidatus Hodarchaeales archaeon]